MRKKDVLIFMALVIVVFVSVFMLTNFVEASSLVSVESQAGERGVNTAYPAPYPAPNFFPLVFKFGE